MFWTIVGAILFVFVGIPLIILALFSVLGLGAWGASTVIENRPDPETRKKIKENRFNSWHNFLDNTANLIFTLTAIVLIGGVVAIIIAAITYPF
jgi:type IV secretory pathway TraG/TraD family ATPase VirD4